MEEVKTTEAAVLAKPQRETLAFIPRNLDDAWRLAELYSKASLLPDALRGKPHDVLIVLMKGSELGLSPMQAIGSISVVKGKPYLDALLKVALVKQSPECEYLRLIESTDAQATFETKRRHEGVTRHTYTLADAQKAGLASNDNYQKRTKLMLRRRCESELCDEVYPDVVRGVATREDDMPEERELNSRPATFAPPKPEAAEAEVVHPTPPAVKGGKVLEHPAKAKAEVKKALDTVTNSDMDRAGAPPVAEPGALDAIGIVMKLADAKTQADLDALAEAAQKIQGPERSKLKESFKAARARIEQAAVGGGAA